MCSSYVVAGFKVPDCFCTLEIQIADRACAVLLSPGQSLLSDPNPNSPANSEAARMYSESRREYNKRVMEIVNQSYIAD